MKLHELRIKSDAFIASINDKIVDSIQSVDNDLVQINKKNMLFSLNAKDESLIHVLTGVSTLSKPYAKRKNKTKPNLYDSGDFQKAMFFSIDENKMTWFIDSEDKKNGILTWAYTNDIFGIPESKTTHAKKLTFVAFVRKYKSEVLK
jgi:hypothetical protein